MRQPGDELPKDTEKQGYKFLLDSLREQLLKRRTIEETAPAPTRTTLPCHVPPVTLPEGKKYFRIGEVAGIIGVEPYVLRYWESEFSSLRPKKTRSGQRVYERREVELLGTIHHLLHVEKYSLQGAKQKLADIRRASRAQALPPPPKSVDPQVLQSVANELRELIGLVREP